jgi:hypothetical protein
VERKKKGIPDLGEERVSRLALLVFACSLRRGHLVEQKIVTRLQRIPISLAMILRLLPLLFLYAQLVARVEAVALTTAIAANERLCFYADVDKAGEKLGVRVCKVFISY